MILFDRNTSGSNPELLRALMEQSSDSIEIVEAATGRFVDINQSGHDDLGYTRDEFLGLTVFDINPNQTPATLAALVRELRSKGHSTFESVHRRKDGSEFPVELSLSLVSKEQEYFLAIARDISERVEAAEQRRQMESRCREQRAALIALSEGFQSAKDALWEITESAAQTLGAARASVWKLSEERSTLHCQCVYDTTSGTHSFGAEYATAESPDFLQAIESEKVLSVESIAHNPRIDLSGAGLFSADTSAVLSVGIHVKGRLHGILCVELRVPHRWLSNEETFVTALANLLSLAFESDELWHLERENHLRAEVLNATANSIMVTDTNGVIKWVNPAFCQTTGYSLEEAVGKNPREIVRSGYHDKSFYDNMWSTLQNGQVWQGETTNRRKDGTLYTELQTITPITDPSGRTTHYAAIKVDVSDQRELQKELIQAQKMESVGRLAGGVAHDFNNILTIIGCYSEMALSHTPDNSKIHGDLLQIHEAADRAASLTRQLLAFSRRQVLRPQIIDLNVVIKDCTRMLNRLVGDGIQIVSELEEQLGFINVDPGQVEQILINLIVNACDAMPDGGRITVESCELELDNEIGTIHPEMEPGKYVALIVSDTGTGMDSATRERIFEPFFTTKEQGKGTGLGLATSYGIVKQSGGSIYVYSEPDKGTTFKIYFPRLVDDTGSDMTARSSGQVVPGIETVLLVEDDEALRVLAERILTAAGYTVLCATDGEHALAMVAKYQYPIHLLLTDIAMPHVNGPELAHILLKEYPDMAVLFMSGYTHAAATANGTLNPDNDLIAKPFTPSILTGRIREVLDVHAR